MKLKEQIEQLKNNNKVQPNFTILNTIGGSSIMGIIEEELEDSFLVKLPARLVSEDGVVLAESYTDVCCMRFFKYALFATAPIYGQFEKYYLQYILTEGLSTHPDAVSEEDTLVMGKRLEELTIPEESFKDINSDEAVSNGFLVPGNSNVKH